jgi:hypothetical protein
LYQGIALAMPQGLQHQPPLQGLDLEFRVFPQPVLALPQSEAQKLFTIHLLK